MTPPLVHLNSPRDYLNRYKSRYCRQDIRTHDGIRVYFGESKFGHAFYENSNHKAGAKDVFSEHRAQRIDWVKYVLEHPEAELHCGWNKREKCHHQDRRVAFLAEDFVVVTQLSLSGANQLKGNFVTCYTADSLRTRQKIREAPVWDLESCLVALRR